MFERENTNKIKYLYIYKRVRSNVLLVLGCLPPARVYFWLEQNALAAPASFYLKVAPFPPPSQNS